jgi:hypothetical protein
MLHCEKTKRITLFKIIRNMIIQNNILNIIFLSFKLHYVEINYVASKCIKSNYVQ